MKLPRLSVSLVFLLGLAPQLLRAQAIQVPDWALPGSATHHQVPPPAGFHRPTVNFATPLGIFEGQSDVGGPLLPGSASYDAATGRYTINSASYNVWYNRDEVRYLWKKVSGDVSLAVDVAFPNPNGYDDRKALLMIRQDLDDDAKEAMTALHGAGLIHLAVRPEKDTNIKEATRLKGTDIPGSGPIRLGIEKHGDTFTLYVGRAGGPMQAVATTATLHLEGPFYVGVAFCSHVPDKSDTTVVSNVAFANEAGKVR
jgi:hypothetical protein